MKKIDSISVERLDNGSHFMFMNDVNTRIKTEAYLMQKESLASLVTALDKAVQKEDECLKLSRKLFTTDQIKDLDDLRDSLYKGYKSIVEAYLEYPQPSEAEAAKYLNQHIKDYNIDPRGNRQKESGLLLNLTADLQGSKYAGYVQTLHLTEYVAQLKLANDQLISATSTRTEERSQMTTGALAEAHLQTDAAYRSLVEMVNALALVEGDAQYAAFIDYMNSLIKEYRQTVLNQSTSGSSSESGTTPAPDSGGNTNPDGTDTPGGTEPEPTPDPTPDTGGDDEDDGGLAG
ncbi:MAG: DUF6261 family protein [Bacteroidaceae bacterium]|nr:DUF6261 family protein [Bacteroidaceae bacterium]